MKTLVSLFCFTLITGSLLLAQSIPEATMTPEGIIFPRYSTVDRDTLIPVAGQCIFNLDSKRIECYDSTQWVSYLGTEGAPTGCAGQTGNDTECDCNDGVDNDGDSMIDELDPDCAFATSPPAALRDAERQHERMDELVITNQELQLKNEALESRLEKLEQLVGQLALPGASQTQFITIDRAVLEQNQPNPFKGSTRISYFLPAGTRNAQLRITAPDGAALQTIELSGVGKGQLVLTADQLPEGTYFYSLVIDGRVSQSRRMVVTQ